MLIINFPTPLPPLIGKSSPTSSQQQTVCHSWDVFKGNDSLFLILPFLLSEGSRREGSPRDLEGPPVDQSLNQLGKTAR